MATEPTRFEQEQPPSPGQLQLERTHLLISLLPWLAHEVRNPLTALQAFAELLPGKFDNLEFRQEAARQIPAQVRRLSGLIADLMGYVDPKPPLPCPCDVSVELDAALSMVRHLVQRGHAHIVTDVPPGVKIWADSVHLRTILTATLHYVLSAAPHGSSVAATAAPSENGVALVIGHSGSPPPPREGETAPPSEGPAMTVKHSAGTLLIAEMTRQNYGRFGMEIDESGMSAIHLWFPGVPVTGA